MAARAWVCLAAIACLAGLAATAGADEADVHPLTTADEEPVPAGVPVTLGWVLTDDEGRPAFHQDARVEVTHEGRPLMATTPASGHDYDGVDPYQVAFPSPGDYTVDVRVHDDGAVRNLTYEGTVTEAPSDALELRLQAPELATAGQRVSLGADVTGPEGRSLEDVELTLRLQRAEDRFEVLKTRLAGEHPSLGYSFARTGSFELVAVAAPLPGGDAANLAPATARQTIQVDRGDATPPVDAPAAQPMVNEREPGERGAGGYELFATFDPYTSVGPDGRLRLGLLTLAEDTHEPARGVDYRVSILDPDDDQILHTGDLHAEDGFEYVTLSRPHEGTYTARIEAVKDDWRDHTVAEFTVLPPTAATNAGPLFASPNATREVDTGQPTTFPVYVEDAAGQPLSHGEVDVRWLDGDGVPLVTGKLHAHENGTLPITLQAHEPGDHRLQLLPQSLQPAPTPFTYGEEVGQPPTFAVEAAGDDVEEPPDAAGGGTANAAGPSWLGALAALAASAGLAARWT
jgi:hypothetical protein